MIFDHARGLGLCDGYVVPYDGDDQSAMDRWLEENRGKLIVLQTLLQLSLAFQALRRRAQFTSPCLVEFPATLSFPKVDLFGRWETVCWFPNQAFARSRVDSAIPQVLKDVEWPEQFPFKQEDFQRYDEGSDKVFYEYPRFVTHIDDPAIKALSQYYAAVFPPSNTPGVAILDMCSSWISHYPNNYRQEKIVGLGLNGDELRRNPVLTDYVVQDLNENPKLPFEDNTFDVITNAVSVDYLTKPLEIFKEMRRVLKPGGLAAMSFSNRCFFTKAISIWTSTDDLDHIWIVGSYFHYAGGYEPPQALDLSPNPGRTDPMYIVFSRKLSA
ncbi:hypothetical protein R1flu_014770 [Riccia fluitans]|uniref:Methyltransferase type 11 domain-containing protein n=1 Tax=Riccia fluitans TaxID=41844 RepID=A0ABD1YKF5_9MARC